MSKRYYNCNQVHHYYHHHTYSKNIRCTQFILFVQFLRCLGSSEMVFGSDRNGFIKDDDTRILANEVSTLDSTYDDDSDDE